MNTSQIVILLFILAVAVGAGIGYFGDADPDGSEGPGMSEKEAVTLKVRAPSRDASQWDLSLLPGDREPVRTFTTEHGIHVQVLREGEGEAVRLGRPIDLRARLFLLNGVMLENGVRKGWVYGQQHKGLEGFNEGLEGIRPQEVRRILVPNEMAHGNRQVGSAPARADVVYEVRWILFAYTDLRVGAGKLAKDGSKVLVTYRGTLEDGTVFDQSKPGQPRTLTLRSGSVIDGFRFGIKGMKEGGERRIWMPSTMAYGKTGSGQTIGPHANLIFLVELIRVLDNP